MAENEASRGGEAERIESGSWKVGTHVPNYSCARSPAWNGVLTLCGARARARCPAPCALPALTALPPFRLTSTAKIGRTTSTRTSSARPSRAHEDRAQVRNCFFKEAAEGLRRGLARAAPLTSTARSPLHAATPVLYVPFFLSYARLQNTLTSRTAASTHFAVPPFPATPLSSGAAASSLSSLTFGLHAKRIARAFCIASMRSRASAPLTPFCAPSTTWSTRARSEVPSRARRAAHACRCACGQGQRTYVDGLVALPLVHQGMDAFGEQIGVPLIEIAHGVLVFTQSTPVRRLGSVAGSTQRRPLARFARSSLGTAAGALPSARAAPPVRARARSPPAIENTHVPARAALEQRRQHSLTYAPAHSIAPASRSYCMSEATSPALGSWSNLQMVDVAAAQYSHGLLMLDDSAQKYVERSMAMHSD